MLQRYKNQLVNPQLGYKSNGVSIALLFNVRQLVYLDTLIYKKVHKVKG